MMNLEVEDLPMEEWNDRIDSKIPGKKRFLAIVFCLLIILAVGVVCIANKESHSQLIMLKIAGALGCECAFFFFLSTMMTNSPLRTPLQFVSKFFFISALFISFFSFFKN